MEEKFIPPQVTIGTPVYYWGVNRSRPPAIAWVTRINEDSVGLSVMPPQSMTLLTAGKNAVMHCDDPRLTEDRIKNCGMWDVTEEWKRAQGLEERIQHLESLVSRKLTERPKPKAKRKAVRPALEAAVAE